MLQVPILLILMGGGCSYLGLTDALAMPAKSNVVFAFAGLSVAAYGLLRMVYLLRNQHTGGVQRLWGPTFVDGIVGTGLAVAAMIATAILSNVPFVRENEFLPSVAVLMMGAAIALSELRMNKPSSTDQPK